SSSASSCPFLTCAPSLTRRRLTVVPIGACASKLCTGSILPLVEITLRIVPRETVAASTGTESSREAKDASKTTANTAPTAHTIQGCLAKKPRFLPFCAIQVLLTIMYHPRPIASDHLLLIWMQGVAERTAKINLRSTRRGMVHPRRRIARASV